MEYLTISIGQAGNQINYELSNLLLNDTENNYKTVNDNLLKNFLIDTEPKVISKYLKNEKMKSYYAEDYNIVTNASGRGNNWALGYNIEYKELKESNSIILHSFEKIKRFIERCGFIRGFTFLHSLNGGTGSGVSTRLIELLKDEFPKFCVIDCPVVGLNSNIYYKFS